MAVQGTIYNEAMWAGPLRRPCAGTRTLDPAEALLWDLTRGVGSCSPGIVIDEGGFTICLTPLFWRRSPDNSHSAMLLAFEPTPAQSSLR